MLLSNNFFTFDSCQLHYVKAGHGPKAILVFHGFGQNHQTFEKLVGFVPEEYTIYNFDIFFHGESKWNKGEQLLTKEFWKELWTAFLNQEKIDRYSLIGFSMGGKFALASYKVTPTRVDHVILLAADGIQKNFWYAFATSSSLIRKLFKSMILHPGRFHRISKLIHKIGLIDNSLLRFVESQMNTEAKRNQVYHSWIVFRTLAFDVKLLAQTLNLNQTEVFCITGKFDRMIPPHFMNKLTKRLHQFRHDTLDVGHTTLIEQSLPRIGNYLGKKP